MAQSRLHLRLVMHLKVAALAALVADVRAWSGGEKGARWRWLHACPA